MKKEKHRSTLIQRQTFYLSLVIGFLLIGTGLVMQTYNFVSSSYSFGTNQGLPYTQPAQYQTLNWWGTIIIGLICIAFGFTLKLGNGKENS